MNEILEEGRYVKRARGSKKQNKNKQYESIEIIEYKFRAVINKQNINNKYIPFNQSKPGYE